MKGLQKKNIKSTTDVLALERLFRESQQNNAKARYPSPYLEINGTLYSYRGHIDFKQYNLLKPAKYGMLYIIPFVTRVSNTHILHYHMLASLKI